MHSLWICLQVCRTARTDRSLAVSLDLVLRLMRTGYPVSVRLVTARR